MNRIHRRIATLGLFLCASLPLTRCWCADLLLEKWFHRYCLDCHGRDTQESGVRFDQLGSDDASGRLLDRALTELRSNRMPPADAEPIEDPTLRQFVRLLDDRLNALASRANHLGEWTNGRRLTNEEYHYTLQSLFGVDAEFADRLPEDPVSSRGYRNAVDRLGVSTIRAEAYLASARRAVKRYVPFDRTDQEPVRYFIKFDDLYYSTAKRYETRKRAPEPVTESAFRDLRTEHHQSPPKYVPPLTPSLPGAFSEDEMLRAAIPKMNQQYVAIPKRLTTGELVVRIRAAGSPDRLGRFPRMRLEAGITLGDGCSMDKRTVGEVDVTASLDQPETYAFRIRLEDVPTKGPQNDGETFDRLSVFDMDQLFVSNVSADRNALFDRGRGAYADLDEASKRIAPKLETMQRRGVNRLHLDCLEIEMFPGVGEENADLRWQVARPNDLSDRAVARSVLSQFLPAAYRRPVGESEMRSKLALFDGLRERGESFSESLRETLVAALVSPSFLFLDARYPQAEDAEQVERNSYRTASRLAYLLWLSPPDDVLLARADDGDLVAKESLRSEAIRMMSDPRHQRFLESFCRQWLQLDRLDRRTVDRKVHPDYDDDLRRDSVRETLETFMDVVRNDRSVLELLDSESVVVNDRLADHYGIANVSSGEFRRVNVTRHSERGGLLSQASLLTMNSDGMESHPIRRAAWLLDRMLGTPPPPPPPNVPELDNESPDVRGSSLRERIALHRQQHQCSACHERIDPWGLPLEIFDATGRRRDDAFVHAERSALNENSEAETILPDGTRIASFQAFKSHLREHRQKEFSQAFVRHLLTYAMGRSPDYRDRLEVASIHGRFERSGYRFDELLLAVIESRLFRIADE